MQRLIFIVLILSYSIFVSSCRNGIRESDAYGNFETREVTVSAQIQGEIHSLDVEEGSTIEEGRIVGYIDSSSLILNRQQLAAQKKVILANCQNILDQIEIQKEQRKVVLKERNRIVRLVKDEAATEQQLDEMEGKLRVIDKQIKSIKSKYTAARMETGVLDIRISQVEEQIRKTRIRNPVTGTVLEQYVEPGELVVPGKAIYKIANLKEMDLRVYLSGAQLPQVKIGQEVTVVTDKNSKDNQELKGKIIWISSDFEFTPKIIQTKEERVNMVYPAKVRVINDGRLKIGMPGEIRFKQQEDK